MLNSIDLQGRMKARPELRYTASNTPVTSFTLAVQRSRKGQDGEYPVDWIDCVAWGKTAERAAQWFTKGDMAIVRGRLESRDWEDKHGNKRRSWEVQVESLFFCDGKKESAGRARPEDIPREPGDFAELADDDSDVLF